MIIIPREALNVESRFHGPPVCLEMNLMKIDKSQKGCVD